MKVMKLMVKVSSASALGWIDVEMMIVFWLESIVSRLVKLVCGLKWWVSVVNRIVVVRVT